MAAGGAVVAGREEVFGVEGAAVEGADRDVRALAVPVVGEVAAEGGGDVGGVLLGVDLEEEAGVEHGGDAGFEEVVGGGSVVGGVVAVGLHAVGVAGGVHQLAGLADVDVEVDAGVDALELLAEGGEVLGVEPEGRQLGDGAVPAAAAGVVGLGLDAVAVERPREGDAHARVVPGRDREVEVEAAGNGVLGEDEEVFLGVVVASLDLLLHQREGGAGERGVVESAAGEGADDDVGVGVHRGGDVGAERECAAVGGLDVPVFVAAPAEGDVGLELLEDPGAGADGALGDGAVVDDLLGHDQEVLGGGDEGEEGRVRPAEADRDGAVLAAGEAVDHRAPAGGVGGDLDEALLGLEDVVDRHLAAVEGLDVVPEDVVADAEDVGGGVDDLGDAGGGVAGDLGAVDGVDAGRALDFAEQLGVVVAAGVLGAVGEVLVGVEGGRVAAAEADVGGDRGAALAGGRPAAFGGGLGRGLARLLVVFGLGFLLGGGVGLLLGLLLLGGRLLLLLLLGGGRAGARLRLLLLLGGVVVIVAAADEGEAGGADAGAGARSEQGSAGEPLPAHPLPVVPLCHGVLLRGRDLSPPKDWRFPRAGRSRSGHSRKVTHLAEMRQLIVRAAVRFGGACERGSGGVAGSERRLWAGTATGSSPTLALRPLRPDRSRLSPR